MQNEESPLSEQVKHTVGRFDPKLIIADWTDAYERANGKAPTVIPKYERGWFVFRSPTGWIRSRYRRADIETMTGRLRDALTRSTGDA